jgi:hypothetical protein
MVTAFVDSKQPICSAQDLNLTADEFVKPIVYVPGPNQTDTSHLNAAKR